MPVAAHAVTSALAIESAANPHANHPPASCAIQATCAAFMHTIATTFPRLVGPAYP